MNTKIIFTEEYGVKDSVGTVYPKGHILNCSIPSAKHFINRGVAEKYKEPKKTKSAEVKQRATPSKSGSVSKSKDVRDNSIGAKPNRSTSGTGKTTSKKIESENDSNK